jgi:aryl-alcohol dehydrogenase-like predicted oxidoreductase
VARGVPDALPDGYSRLPEAMRTRLERATEERKARWQAAEKELEGLLDGMTRMEFLLRFTLSHPALHTTIVGTANAANEPRPGSYRSTECRSPMVPTWTRSS